MEPAQGNDSLGASLREDAAAADLEAASAPAPGSEGSSFQHLVRELSSGGVQSDVNLSMEWKDVSFSIGEKQILKNITGLAEPGQFTAVLGPSGSGKTTLLNLLAGRQRTSGPTGPMPMTGDVTVAGRSISLEEFKSNIAYVMQDDRLMATETVRECIEFSAYMRRPGSQEERAAFVQRMLDTLGLNKCANTIAGNALMKGISGGERKRACVGIELITDPKMLFLDEPLSGLDSYAAYTLILALKDLAKAGVPVVCTVHQPSSEIFAMFDSVVVLHDGEVVYHGPVELLANHFDKWEKCPSNFNPADHVMFLLQKEAEEAGSRSRIREMKDAWLECDLGKRLRARVEQSRATSAHAPLALSEAQQGSRLGFGAQLSVLTRREVRGTLRNTGVLAARYGMSIFLALLYAWLFAGTGSKDGAACGIDEKNEFDGIQCPSAFQAHLGTIVSLSIASMMGAAQPVLLQFPNERPIFLREYTAKQYGVIPYFVSKTLVELPVVLLSQLLMYLVAYWVMGLQGDFVWLVLIAWALGITSSSLSLIVGCGVAAAEKAIQFGPLTLVPQMLFSGLFIPVSKIPVSLQWVKWLCPLKYAINLAALVEFQSVDDGFTAHECDNPLNEGRCVGLRSLAGALDGQDMRWDDMTRDALILAALFVAFRIIACMLLWRKGRYVF